MDIGWVIGMVLGLIVLFIGITTAGGTVPMFIDIPSFVVTIFGSVASMLVAYPIPRLAKIPTLIKMCLNPPKFDPKELIVTVVSFSEKARREGLLALEDDLNELKDPFMKKGLQLVVDGTDPELVRNILETDIDSMAGRHDDNKRMFDDIAGFAPSFGMIGTLMGLVMMLVNLNDKASIGPFLAVAILTTLYGAVIAYAWFSPMAVKLDMLTAQEIMIKSIVLTGILSIQSGDNPRIVKDKLISYLSPAARADLPDEDAK